MICDYSARRTARRGTTPLTSAVTAERSPLIYDPTGLWFFANRRFDLSLVFMSFLFLYSSVIDFSFIIHVTCIDSLNLANNTEKWIIRENANSFSRAPFILSTTYIFNCYFDYYLLIQAMKHILIKFICGVTWRFTILV